MRPVLQYSVKTSGIPISEVRQKYAQPILGGVDEIDYRKLTTEEIRTQWTEAKSQAGAKYIAAPGCSIPNESTPDELRASRNRLEFSAVISSKVNLFGVYLSRRKIALTPPDFSYFFACGYPRCGRNQNRVLVARRLHRSACGNGSRVSSGSTCIGRWLRSSSGG